MSFIDEPIRSLHVIDGGDFFQRITTFQVRRAVDHVLSIDPVLSYADRVIADQMGEFTPDWLNTHGLIPYISQLNSSRMWNSLMREYSPNMPIGHEPVLKVSIFPFRSTDIKESNSLFMYKSMREVVAGAVYDQSKLPRGAHSPVTQSVLQYYSAPPESNVELLSRMQTLLPDPDKLHGKDLTMYDLLIENNSFAGNISDLTSKKRWCPAIKLTKLIFDEWGRHFNNDEVYIQRFLSAVQK